MAILELRNVDVVFGDKPNRALEMLDSGKTRDEIRRDTDLFVAAQNISLQILKGEIFVLMGLSGSGKSTVLRTLNALCTPTRGQVLLKGVDVTSMKDEQLREVRTRSISMVFQSAALMPWRTVFDNVAIGLELQHLSKDKIRERAMQALNLVGLKDWALQYPEELSGGMRQRVGIARALATGTEVILMDEPFSALDPLIRQQLQDELLHLQNDLKKTIVFVTHDLEEAMRLASRLAILQEGQIVQIGTPTEIVENPSNDHVRRFVASLDRVCPKCKAISVPC